MNYFQILKLGSKKLKLNNIDSHIIDSELILSYTLNLPREKILTNLDKNINFKNFKKYKTFIRREKKNLQHILLRKRILKIISILI